MNQEQTNEIELRAKGIMALLVRFNSLFSKAQRETDETLLVWANYLAKRNFTVKQIGFALTELSKKSLVFMPSSHEIVGVLIPAIPPKEFRAEKIATEIHEAILNTLSGSKSNFTDEMPADTLATVEALGGYRVLKETDLSKDINRARLVKGAMAVLMAEEARVRNNKLTQQGIACTSISSFDVQKIESPEELAKNSPQPSAHREASTNNELKPLNLSTEEVSKEIRGIRESILEEVK